MSPELLELDVEMAALQVRHERLFPKLISGEIDVDGVEE